MDNGYGSLEFGIINRSGVEASAGVARPYRLKPGLRTGWVRYNTGMRYETRNHIGMGLATLGSLIVMIGLLWFELGSVGSWLWLAGGALVGLAGFWLLTRGFTQADVDHPDYRRWHETGTEGEESAENRDPS